MAKVERNSYYVRPYTYKRNLGETPVPGTTKWVITKIEGPEGGDGEVLSEYTITKSAKGVKCDCPANYGGRSRRFTGECRHHAIFVGWHRVVHERPPTARPLEGVVYYNTEDKTYYEIPPGLDGV